MAIEFIKNPDERNDPPRPLLEHLLALRDMIIFGAVSWVVCAVIAILRMVRDITDGISRRPIIYLLVLDIIIMFFIYDTSAALQLKQDNADTTSNLVRISRQLKYVYEEEHGSYPPQQDFKSLLETLGMKDSDFTKTWFYDIYSAEYHAPAEDSNDPIETIITIRQRYVSEDDAYLLFLRRISRRS